MRYNNNERNQKTTSLGIDSEPTYAYAIIS